MLNKSHFWTNMNFGSFWDEISVCYNNFQPAYSWVSIINNHHIFRGFRWFIFIPKTHPHTFLRQRGSLDKRDLRSDPLTWRQRWACPTPGPTKCRRYQTKLATPAILGYMIWSESGKCFFIQNKLRRNTCFSKGAKLHQWIHNTWS